jgi:rhomboid protease GluP
MRIRLPLHRPRSVYVLLALNVAIFFIPVLLDAIGLGQRIAPSLALQLNNGLPSELRGLSTAGVGLRQLVELLGVKDNSAIYNDGQYYRLLTATFLHGGLLHIAFNAFAIYALGPECERLYGTGRFLLIYFIAGLSGSLASYAFNASPSLGASGAVFGLAGGLAAFYYLLRDLLGSTSRMQLNNIAAILFINLLIGFSAAGTIDNYGHIGGLIGGGLAGLILTPRLAVDRRFYPPQIVQREHAPLAWGLALALLLAVCWAATVIVPPL